MKTSRIQKFIPHSPDENRRVLTAHLINEINDEMSERDFQRDFFESVHDQFLKKGFVTDNQLAALNRIYERVTR